MISEAVLSNVNVQIGERSIGASNETVETKVRSSSYQVLTLVGTMGSGTLSLTKVATPFETSAEYHETSFGFSAIISSSLIGIFILKCVEGKNQIKQLQDTLCLLQDEFETAEPLEQERLAGEINGLEQLIFRESAHHQRMFDLVLSNVCQGSLASIRQSAILVNIVQPGSEIASNMGSTAGIAVAVCPLLALFFGSKNLRKLQKTAVKLRKELTKIEALLLEDDRSPLQNMALHLRQKNLKKQEEELAICASKEFFTITSGALGTAATIKLIVTSIGMGAGILFGTALTATGIGAIATGAIALLIGSAYIIRKNEEDIRYYSEDKKLAFEQAIKASYLTFVEKRQNHLKSQFKKIEGYIELAREENNEDFYRAKIDEVWEKIQELNHSLTNAKEISRLERKHQKLILACIGERLGGKRISPDQDWTLIETVNEGQKRVCTAADKVEIVKVQRRRLSETHIYRKYLVRFGGGVTLEDLKTFEVHFANACPKERTDLKHLFFDRLGSTETWIESMNTLTEPIN